MASLGWRNGRRCAKDLPELGGTGMGEHGAICRLGVFYDGSFFSYAQHYYYHERQLIREALANRQARKAVGN